MADYVIVGAGSAGCVMASRLSEDSTCRVVLIEAGGSDKRLEVRMPAGYGKLFKSDLDWDYETEPEPHLFERRLYVPRGRLLGGSSSINAMVYIRGRHADYDGWRDLGCPGWGFDDVLPYFVRSEDQARGASRYHGTGGPLHVSEQRSPNPFSTAFVESARAAGLAANDDFNGETQLGAGLYQVTQWRGRRWSAANAFLHPARRRPNLEIITGAQATRVILEGTRATGVEIVSNGGTREVRADAEVIVCGGAINSPQLLQLSGIGPADLLEEHGIEVAVDLPGVGENLQDHPAVGLTYHSNRPISLLVAGKLRHLIRYLLFRSGPLTTCVAEAGGFIDTDSGLTGPDIQYHFAPVLYLEHGLEPVDRHGVSLGPTLVAPTSRGHVRLRSADPLEKPSILTNSLSHDAEVAAMRKGLQLGREILASPPLADFLDDERDPGSDRVSNAELEAHVRENSELLYHPVGTCKMGTDDRAVVDPELRVHGVERLRVVDASIMPVITGGNTNAPTIMIAEKAADLIRQPKQLSAE